MAKTPCPITREQFRQHAQALEIQIGTEAMDAEVKEFSTGSLGWYVNGKIKMEVDGVKVPVQIGMNMTIVGSKDLPGREVVEAA